MADYQSEFTGAEIDSRLSKVSQLETDKQDKLVSGTNIKTINDESILGSGDITIADGEDGVGFESVASPTPADGTIVITLSNGDKMTLDLNHNHGQYTKVQVCEDQSEYNAIVDKDPMTFYVIPGVALYLGGTLVVEQGSPLPYTPVDYIETDGVAYIDTGKKANPTMSAEIKLTPVSTDTTCTYLGARTGTANTDTFFVFFQQWGSTHYLASACGRTSLQGVSMSSSLTNVTPLLAKAILSGDELSLSVKEGSSAWVDASGTSSVLPGTANLNIFLFADNIAGTVGRKAPSGTRIHYVKMYSDNTYTNLVFDGVPCYYNGQYGIWDKVSNTFFGNEAVSGAFSGPSNS